MLLCGTYFQDGWTKLLTDELVSDTFVLSQQAQCRFWHVVIGTAELTNLDIEFFDVELHLTKISALLGLFEVAGGKHREIILQALKV